MPRNDGGALPGENDGGAPQQIPEVEEARLFGFQLNNAAEWIQAAAGWEMTQVAGRVFARQLDGLYAGLGRQIVWGPGCTAEAEQAAGDALERALTPQQASTWRRREWFTLRSNLGHWWRIRGNGVSGNVDLLSSEHGPPLAAYCAHPDETMPYAAIWLSQLLTLTCDETRFTRVAICHYGYPLPDGLQVPGDVQALLPDLVPWVNMNATWAAR